MGVRSQNSSRCGKAREEVSRERLCECHQAWGLLVVTEQAACWCCRATANEPWGEGLAGKALRRSEQVSWSLASRAGPSKQI